MSADKDYCLSSFLAFRYIYENDKDFYKGLKHKYYVQKSDDEKIFVKDEFDVDKAIKSVFDNLKGRKLGIMLSGGMDSAILASYMSGCDAYTFRFLNGKMQSEELKRAEFYASKYNLNLHYIDIDWNIVEKNVDLCMKNKMAPVHSIEPQIYEAAIQAKKDGIEIMIIGDASDYVFGGMDKLLSKDWTFDEFYKRFIYVDPADVLVNPVDIKYVFEKYRLEKDKIDYLAMMDSITIDESYASYHNAFETANMVYEDPYELLKMIDKLDLKRIRNGESKYIIRNLFKLKYPDFDIPEKIPMPRPVDEYFKNWNGPLRKEFRHDIDYGKFNGNQKWLIWCLERFLNLYEV